MASQSSQQSRRERLQQHLSQQAIQKRAKTTASRSQRRTARDEATQMVDVDEDDLDEYDFIPDTPVGESRTPFAERLLNDENSLTNSRTPAVLPYM
jgi:hypothetical protein